MTVYRGFSLDARRFDITYDAGVEAHEPWTLVLPRERPGDRFTLTINRQPFSGVVGAVRALRITRAAP